MLFDLTDLKAGPSQSTLGRAINISIAKMHYTTCITFLLQIVTLALTLTCFLGCMRAQT